MEELLKFLHSIYPLSDNLTEYLSTNLKTKKLSKKDFLLKKGHVSRDICFINKGLLRCFYLLDDKEVSSWFMKEGDVIIMKQAKISAEGTYHKCMRDLKDGGYIQYIPSYNPLTGSLIYL